MKLKAIRHRQEMQGFDPDRLEHLLSGSRLENHILSSSKCHVKHLHWSCGPVTIDTGIYSFPVRIRGGFPKGKISFGVMRSQDTPVWVNGFDVGQDTLELYPAGSEVNYRAGVNGEWMALEIDEEYLQAVSTRRLGYEIDLPKSSVRSYRVPASQRRELDRFVDRLIARTELNEELIVAFLGFLVELLDHLQGIEMESLLKRSHHRNELILRAESFMRVHVGQPFNARALAAATGTTERTLQRVFSDAYGMTPGEWARCLALHRARRLLRTSDPRRCTVEGVASECGFRHPGRFSQYYRELFGNLPSEMLQK